MLFLTATPFQLGHQELVRVLDRFGDVRWDLDSLGEKAAFQARLANLENSLTESQRTAIALQRCWSRLRLEESPDGDPDHWWQSLQDSPRESLTPRQQAICDAFEQARHWRSEAPGDPARRLLTGEYFQPGSRHLLQFDAQPVAVDLPVGIARQFLHLVKRRGQHVLGEDLRERPADGSRR